MTPLPGSLPWIRRWPRAHAAVALLVALAGCGKSSAAHDGGITDGASVDGTATCGSQCECPAGTLCSIDHACVGTPRVDPCGPNDSCPCGQACVDGFCPPFVGSLRPCTASCECGDETCVAHHCVAAAGGSAGHCTSNDQCADCAGTICILPEQPSVCATADHCTQDLHCVTQVGPGTECVCADGTAPHSSRCYPLGDCAPIPGQAYVTATPFAFPTNPSGLCSGPESATLTVAGVAGHPSGVVLYLEATGVPAGGQGFMAMLRPPAGAAQLASIYYTGSDHAVAEVPLTSLPTSVNGTWTLCGYLNPGATPIVISTWGVYIAP